MIKQRFYCYKQLAIIMHYHMVGMINPQKLSTCNIPNGDRLVFAYKGNILIITKLTIKTSCIGWYTSQVERVTQKKIFRSLYPRSR